jgi:hypothetical protein
MATTMTMDERADALEAKMSDELDVILTKSALANMEDGKLGASGMGLNEQLKHPGKLFLIGDDPRLPKMPAKPTLLDFFKYRARGANHLLQSATHALNAGMDEKIIMACLVHDMANAMFIKSDHGYWGAQLLEPYVDEEVSWAIRAHQALRFFPDESVGYKYPVLYTNYFGEDYVPDEYIQQAYQRARTHKWYMTARLITVHDIYSFDPNAKVSWEPFVDIIVATSGSRKRAWAMTTARSPICGGRSGGRPSISERNSSAKRTRSCPGARFTFQGYSSSSRRRARRIHRNGLRRSSDRRRHTGIPSNCRRDRGNRTSSRRDAR